MLPDPPTSLYLHCPNAPPPRKILAMRLNDDTSLRHMRCTCIYNGASPYGRRFNTVTLLFSLFLVNLHSRHFHCFSSFFHTLYCFRRPNYFLFAWFDYAMFFVKIFQLSLPQMRSKSFCSFVIFVIFFILSFIFNKPLSHRVERMLRSGRAGTVHGIT